MVTMPMNVPTSGSAGCLGFLRFRCVSFLVLVLRYAPAFGKVEQEQGRTSMLTRSISPQHELIRVRPS